MSSTATPLATGLSPCERLEAFVDEINELTGQRNAIDGRLVAWKTGVTPRNAEVMVAVAHRLPEFPRCVEGMREGRLSLDQVGVIAEHAAEGSDAHYAQFAESATVTQLRTAVKLELRPDPEPTSEPERSITKTTHDDGSTTYRIRSQAGSREGRRRPGIAP